MDFWFRRHPKYANYYVRKALLLFIERKHNSLTYLIRTPFQVICIAST